MKRFFYAVLAVAATLSIASCNREEDKTLDSNDPKDGNKLAFTVGAATRSATVGMADSMRGGTISLGEPIEGQAFRLEETVTSLDDPSYFTVAETRGTPVYSENFLTVSGGKFRGLAFKSPAAGTAWSIGSSTRGMPTGIPIADSDFEYKGEFWELSYEWDPWFDSDPILFYGRLVTDDWTTSPGSVLGVLPNSYQFIYSAEGVQSMSFSYRSPLTAEMQQDILFAARTITKQEGRKAVPILFYHALTGVKFATAHKNEDDVKTYIKKVELTGIYGYGKCTITSTAENGGYSDDPEVHSSANAVSWTFSGTPSTNSLKNVYSQSFSETPVDYTSGSFETQGDYPSSFSAAGNKNNLNDGDATKTFWLPAQVLSTGAKVIITFEIEGKDGSRKSYTREIDLSGNDWKAGQLRTYTLKSSEVDVEIEDVVENHVKKDVVISNVGNAPAYIRAQIVGGWYGKAGSEDGVAMGFTSSDDNNFDYVQPWNDVLNTSSEYVPYGTFSELPGTNWIKGSDGYFYYTQIVMPGEETGTKLFDTYTLDTSRIPTIYYVNSQSIRVAFTDVRLLIDIPVQGVIAPLKDGSTTENPQYQDYKAAWAAAGVTAPDAPVNP